MYAVAETGALGTVNGLAFPLSSHERGGYQYNRPFGVSFKDTGISYVLDFDGLHTLAGQGFLNEQAVAMVTLRRIGYE
jgi:hypothetical protein